MVICNDFGRAMEVIKNIAHKKEIVQQAAKEFVEDNKLKEDSLFNVNTTLTSVYLYAADGKLQKCISSTRLLKQ